MKNPVEFNTKKLELSYVSKDKTYELRFGKEFKLNGTVIDIEYSRYDSPYAKAEKKDETLTFEYNGKSLFLDFNNLKREF